MSLLGTHSNAAAQLTKTFRFWQSSFLLKTHTQILTQLTQYEENLE